jgi:hypothetical protein
MTLQENIHLHFGNLHDLWKIAEDLRQIEKNWSGPKIALPPKPPVAKISRVSIDTIDV